MACEKSYWTNGRPPATFKAENVSVKKGCLRITNTVLSPTEGLDGKPGDKYSLAGGAVASVKNQAHYGYYETRMKLRSLPCPLLSGFPIVPLKRK